MHLANTTNEQVKAYAEKMGYTFLDEDCEHLRAESFKGETLKQAINDYLNAYER
jgi:hypothetical protein